MYKFKLPIGDWSDDGHGSCDYYIIESNISALDLVPIYNAMDEKYKISGECSKYLDSLLSLHFIETIRVAGLDPSDYIDNIEEPSINSFKLASLIMDLLMIHDNSLKLKMIEEEEIPMLNNWLAQSYYKKSSGGYLRLPGYGLFE